MVRYGIVRGMDATPHTHALRVDTGIEAWYVVYGDQVKRVNMPRFRNPEKVLASAVRKIVAKHDHESLLAGERAVKAAKHYEKDRQVRQRAEAAADTIRNTMGIPDDNRWGSEQLR